MARQRVAAVIGLAVLLLASAPWSSPAAEPSSEALRRLEKDLSAGRDRQTRLERQSEALKADLAALRAKLIVAGDEAARKQADVAAIDATLGRTEADDRQQTAALAAHRREISELVAALYRLSLTPPEALIVRPEAPIDALRTALLLQTALPALRARSEALAGSLDRLQNTRRRLKSQREEAVATRIAYAVRLQEISDLVAEREGLARETDSERQQNAQRMAALAGQATDLRQLMERVEGEHRRAALAEPPPPPPPRPPESGPAAPAESAPPLRAGHQAARLPTAGGIATDYGETDRFGTTSRGLHIAAQAGAPVVAPMDGTIKFAGRFRTYGQILIVEHRNGYHSLIAGLGRIDTSVGRAVSAGEPIGVVAEPADAVPDLYFELRRNGQPINPRSGLPALDGKGQG
ncbi:MAG: peptidoglycan DD-metalloendopeptidase family protein [Rhodospirillaceae bacterium]